MMTALTCNIDALTDLRSRTRSGWGMMIAAGCIGSQITQLATKKYSSVAPTGKTTAEVDKISPSSNFQMSFSRFESP